MDSLLLAAFARAGGLPRGARGLDLGCGCGVVGLTVLLANSDHGLQIMGLDIDPEMTRCACVNAKKLGFQSQFSAILNDISKYDPIDNPYDFVLANPPYHPLGQGRTSPRAGRARACFETETSLDAFARVAAKALKTRGTLCSVHPPQRLREVLDTLAAHRLEPKRLRCVHGRPGSRARILLVEARKHGRPGLAVDPPLVLHQGAALSREALEFCPFLACDPAPAAFARQ